MLSHEDFTTINNEQRNYRELKESNRMMKSQRSDAEKNNLIEHGKRKVIDEIIDKMYKYKTMLSYCLQCKKIQRT